MRYLTEQQTERAIAKLIDCIESQQDRPNGGQLIASRLLGVSEATVSRWAWATLEDYGRRMTEERAAEVGARISELAPKQRKEG